MLAATGKPAVGLLLPAKRPLWNLKPPHLCPAVAFPSPFLWLLRSAVGRPRSLYRTWAKFLYRDGGWVVANCGWDDELNELHVSQSDGRPADSYVEEWWRFFGGRGVDA